MGDRGNVAIIQENGDQIWLYSHWGGTQLPARVQLGLKASKPRWDDESYFTKIMLGRLVPNDNWMEETGYGISGTVQDGAGRIVVVDSKNKIVYTITGPELKDNKVPAGYEPPASWNYEAYMALTELPWGEPITEDQIGKIGY